MKQKAKYRGASLSRYLLSLSILWLFHTAEAQQGEWIYIVVKHDTLWDLSEKYFPNVGYWKKFQALNGIEEPKRITPGVRLRVPMAWLSDQPVPARILAVKGDVKLTPAKTSSLETVSVGTLIHLGDRLQTAADASASIEFADGSVVDVRQQTDLVFDHLSAYSDTGMVDTRLRLSNGRMDIRARPAAGPGSRFEIHTPAAISAVRGTQYRTAAQEAQSATWVEVLEGKVAATGSDTTAMVPAAYGTRVLQGDPPMPPRPLLQAPELQPIPEKIERIGWPLTWFPVTGAKGYHTEVASQADFSLVLWERYSDGPRVSLPDLADGSYHVRVRAIDDLDIEGMDRQQRIELDARPQPPVPLAPRDEGASRSPMPKLSWSDSSEATSYRLQLASDPAFTRLHLDRHRLAATSLKTPALPLGKYHWRLASISASGEQGPFAPPRTFEILAVPEKPEASLAADAEKVVASWQAGTAGQTYQVQVAEDPGFQRLLADASIAEPRFELPQVKGMLRYLRVRIVEPDGYLGPWGAVQKIDPLPDRGWIYLLLGGLLGILIL
jgi:hypothetical protein